jgi:hexosaminidase
MITIPLHHLRFPAFLSLTGCVGLLLPGISGAAPEAPALVPQPLKLELKSGSFEFTSKTAVVAGPGAAVEAQKLATALRQPMGLALTVSSQESAAGASLVTMQLDSALTSKLGAEGYQLSVNPSQVTIRAGTDAGLFYGGITLRQLLPPEVFGTAAIAQPPAGGWKAPCVEIEDTPRFVWRGLLLDVARHFLQPAEVKQFIDLMALHKMNTLQLHLTDDQGWRLEIKKYPRLTEVGSVRRESPKPGDRNHGDGTPYGPFFYTQEQMRDLIAYAQARHITIMPEIEMPGHVLGVLAAFPELSCKGGPFQVRTQWGVEPDVLCIGNPKSLPFMQDILTEVVELFPSRFIHIGGDECPRDRWKTCPKCQALLKAQGLNNEAQLQTWFNQHIEEFLASKGRRLIGWDEILEGGLTPGAAVMSWRGTAGGTDAARAGHDVVMTPTSHCYLDYAQSKARGEPECIGGYLPLQTVYAYEPVPAKLPEAQRKHILGTQGNLWSEYLPTLQRFEYNAFPRACALAEIGWSPVEKKDFKDFCARLEPHLRRLDQLKVNYRHLDELAAGR